MVKQTQTFEGLVMSRQNYRESDMLVKILTDQFGKKNVSGKPGPQARFYFSCWHFALYACGLYW
ncbi:hypothetical protein N577_003965 [Lacticaseibacillus rhamnosus 2166]|nr:hypothetical protein N577_003965 [Lacticaseibacillus rhamnosus 2166]